MTRAEPHAPTAMPDLAEAACYPHAVEAIRVIETHISRVYLTGRYAYKLKKPVALGFLDFTTLEARRRCCEDELALNRRLAPGLYLEVVSVHETPDGPRISGTGRIVDYAVKMLEFPQAALASALLARGQLHDAEVTGLAARIAAFHAGAPSDAGGYGAPEAVQAAALQNFEQIGACRPGSAERRRLGRLHAWTVREYAAVRALLQARRADGRVREVHGDLHLGNIVRLDSELVPFDCIEFNAALRWNDVISEAAFIFMDLVDRGAPRLADLFLDAYLAETGDYEGTGVLRYFVVYRALVRAKIHLMRARQVAGDRCERDRLAGEFGRYLALAARCARRRKPFVLLMHGLAASGKSTVARELVQAYHAIRVRSDVERKRLAGLPARAASGSPLGGGLYSADRSDATYARLAALAHDIVSAGYPAVIDATFLRRSHRQRCAAVAQDLGVRWAIVEVQAPLHVLRERLAARAAGGGDPSEATAAVLDRQLEMREPLTPAERRRTVSVSGTQGADGAAYAALRRRTGTAADIATAEPHRAHR